MFGPHNRTANKTIVSRIVNNVARSIASSHLQPAAYIDLHVYPHNHIATRIFQLSIGPLAVIHSIHLEFALESPMEYVTLLAIGWKWRQAVGILAFSNIADRHTQELGRRPSEASTAFF